MLVGSELMKWGCNVYDICLLCDQVDENETVLHVLVTCLIARDCWRLVFASSELSNELHSIYNFLYLARSIKRQRGGQAYRKQIVVLYTSLDNLEVMIWCSLVKHQIHPRFFCTLSQAKEVWCIDEKCDPFLSGVN